MKINRNEQEINRLKKLYRIKSMNSFYKSMDSMSDYDKINESIYEILGLMNINTPLTTSRIIGEIITKTALDTKKYELIACLPFISVHNLQIMYHVWYNYSSDEIINLIKVLNIYDWGNKQEIWIHTPTSKNWQLYNIVYKNFMYDKYIWNIKIDSEISIEPIKQKQEYNFSFNDGKLINETEFNEKLDKVVEYFSKGQCPLRPPF